MNHHDTIAAIATAIAPEQGSVGIVRLSGSKSEVIARSLFHNSNNQIWETHRILYGYIKHPVTKEVIDESLMLIMKAPRSFTREDVIEFHCHGGIMPVQRVLNLCLEQGARLAEAGEFSLRAFLNGRIDLTQAESIQELVGAKSPQAAQTAIASLQGKLAHPIRQMRAKCVDILAEIEARIDFDDDLVPLNLDNLLRDLQEVTDQAHTLMATADRGQLLRSGLKIAIAGRPNVGKSSLLNAWSQTDRAIVTDLPGTTRDVVDSQLIVSGIPVTVLDTAGIRATEDIVEKIGVERSLISVKSADLVLLVIDAQIGWTDQDQEIYELITDLKTDGDHPIILVINKMDLPTYPPILPSVFEKKPIVYTAAALAQGIDQLELAILNSVHQGSISSANLEVAINQRQKASLLTAVQALERVLGAIALPLDFWTIDLREAIHALGQITGEEITESVLDTIFSKFCIGK
ncbi:tRNA modification GTPase TrmE [Synechococcus sp. PCC 7502]|uniref:tRNA uridine-5-carboxymethylaminomethyl(34) synthesis GTPase MnmE n=1 Tax=Synechococcus sp. PCC 7502 TaxID=1173263 RepID=UPI00029FE645|nr:tRNA uridine-5-carboxymethylaminomethyl(34) synthesis GTPase MnmE [Synechococcus sp. PCC 7502]AFY72647.1 tRNA modification GTPase TrmE [Synechococcus sp. PCC 7502]